VSDKNAHVLPPARPKATIKATQKVVPPAFIGANLCALPCG
jgi:hypothetical protein